MFNVDTDPDQNGENNAAIAFANAFNYISTNKNAYDALAFITDVYSKSEDDSEDVDVKDQCCNEDFRGAHCKAFIIGCEPLSTVHYTKPGSSIKRPTPN